MGVQTVWLIGYGSSLGERLTGYENLYSSQPYLMVNYMEIQDFVELPCISLLPYTWNHTEHVIENYETILEKVLEKCLNFFSENLYSPCQSWDSAKHDQKVNQAERGP